MGGAILGARSDVGWVAATTLQQLATYYVAKKNYDSAKEINAKQIHIAQQNQTIANELNTHLRDNYFPCEIKALNEMCSTPLPEVDYSEQSGRFATTARLQFGKVREQLERRYSRFCCANHMNLLKELALAEAASVTDNVNFGYRVAEARNQALIDVRNNNLFRALGMGRGLASTALSYSSAAGATFSSLGTQASTAAGQAINEIFYQQRQRQGTQASRVDYQPQSPQFAPEQQPQQFPVGLGAQQYVPTSQSTQYQGVANQQFALPNTPVNSAETPIFNDNYGVGTSGDDR